MKYTLLTSLCLIVLSWCTVSPSTDTAKTPTAMNMDHSMMMDHMDHATMINNEEQFIAEMIPHHQEAVDSSIALLQANPNPELTVLLNLIVDGQSKEIAMMQWWLQSRYPNSSYTPMYQMMMRDTSTISAIGTLERMYLEDMIMHHEWAVQMAEKVLTLNPRPEVAAFAQQVIDVQQQEISQMQWLLKNL